MHKFSTNLPRFQGARPDHVRVESSSCCFPRELVSFDPWHVTRSPPIGERIWVGRYNNGFCYIDNTCLIKEATGVNPATAHFSFLAITVEYRNYEPLCKENRGMTKDILRPNNSKMYWKEPRYNEPLCKENRGMTKDILRPNNSKMYWKEPRYNEPLCKENRGMTKDILRPNNSKIYRKEPLFKENSGKNERYS